MLNLCQFLKQNRCLFLGLVEATVAFKIWKEFKDKKEELEVERLKKKPAPFKMVKVMINFPRNCKLNIFVCTFL